MKTLRNKILAVVLSVSTLISGQTQALTGTMDVIIPGGSIWFDVSPLIDFGYRTPFIPFRLDADVEVYLNSTDFFREMVRSGWEKVDDIMGDPGDQFTVKAPVYFNQNLNGPSTRWVPNGTSSIKLKLQSGNGNVRWKVKNLETGSWVYNSTSATTGSITLTKKASATSNSTYSTNEGRNRLLIRECKNSACTTYDERTVTIMVDSYRAPAMYIDPIGLPTATPVSGKCNTADYYYLQGNGEEICARVAHEGIDGYLNSSILVGEAVIFIFDKATQKGKQVVDSVHNPALPTTAVENLCSANWIECALWHMSVGIAGTYHAMCNAGSETYATNAVRHSVLNAAMALALRSTLGAVYNTNTKAANRALVWSHAIESGGCPSSNPDIQADCIHDQIGADTFLSYPTSTLLFEKAYQAALDNGVRWTSGNPYLTQADRDSCLVQPHDWGL